MDSFIIILYFLSMTHEKIAFASGLGWQIQYLGAFSKIIESKLLKKVFKRFILCVNSKISLFKK